MALFECSSCRRHVRDHETSCPFCGIVRASMIAAAAVMVGCSPSPPAVMALYGGPPVDNTPRADAGDSTAPTSTASPTAAPTASPTADSPTNVPAYGGPPPPAPTMAPMYGGPPGAGSPRR